MIRPLLLILFVIVSGSATYSQNFRYVEVNTGFRVFSAMMTENDRFRADAYSYGSGSGVLSLRTTYNVVYAGAKGEMFLSNEKFRIGVGIQYSQMTGKIDNDNGWGDYNPNRFFFYRYRESGTTTEYVTIEKMEQSTSYVGVPVDVRFFPFNPRRFNLYFKVGAELNIRVATETAIDFHEPSMEEYKGEITETLAEPDAVSGLGYVAAGIQFGRPGQFKFGLEVPAPCFSLSPDATGIVKPTAGGGFMIFIAIPLTKSTNE
jgi:hypothetical protein